jgi:hypothetical protein
MSDNEFKVGDRVQLVNEDNEIENVGVIQELHSREDNGEVVDFANVIWEDNITATEEYISVLQLKEDTSELEAEFKKVVKAHQSKIDEQLAIAAKAIAKAEKISEKYGIPFHSSVSPLSQPYWPSSFSTKFGGLDSDFVSDITGTYNEYDSEGWRHSAVC